MSPKTRSMYAKQAASTTSPELLGQGLGACCRSDPQGLLAAEVLPHAREYRPNPVGGRELGLPPSIQRNPGHVSEFLGQSTTPSGISV